MTGKKPTFCHTFDPNIRSVAHDTRYYKEHDQSSIAFLLFTIVFSSSPAFSSATLDWVFLSENNLVDIPCEGKEGTPDQDLVERT